MERQVIRILEEQCDGCGLCARGCPEGALQVIDGKARLVSEVHCDGLGACLGECPRGAIRLETREARPYDEVQVLDRILPQGEATLKAHLRHLRDHGQTTFLAQARARLEALGLPFPALENRGGCPGAASRDLAAGRKPAACPGAAPRALAPAREPVPGPGAAPRLLADAGEPPSARSHLSQWPIQLHLVSPSNPVFQGAQVLLAADCTVAALPGFHQEWLPGRRLLMACPKLDQDQETYREKLTAFMDEARIASLTVLIMEVPCCSGLLRLAQAAAARAARPVPIRAVVVGVDGQVRREGLLEPAGPSA
jgi:ferredoxin